MDVERALNGRQITTRFLRQHKYGELSLSTVCAVVQPAILGEPKKMISHLFPAGYGVRLFPYPFCTYVLLRTSTRHNKGLLPCGLISEESMPLTPPINYRFSLSCNWLDACVIHFLSLFASLFDFGPTKESARIDQFPTACIRHLWKKGLHTCHLDRPKNSQQLIIILFIIIIIIIIAAFFPLDPHIRGRIIFFVFVATADINRATFRMIVRPGRFDSSIVSAPIQGTES